MSSLMSSTKIRTYSELSRLSSFEDRYRYLRLNGAVCDQTFGIDRYLNQRFYRSREWKTVRDSVILRDNGCDLGAAGHEIYGRILIHHMNPLSIEDLVESTEFLMNPEYLITTTHETHNAIHYGDESLLFFTPVERTPFDTCPWKRKEIDDGNSAEHRQYSDFCKKIDRHNGRL